MYRRGVIELRDVTEDDLPIFFEHQRDPEAAAMAVFEPRERDAFLDHWGRILGDDGLGKQTIVVDGAVAGNVVAFDVEGQRHVGYWVDREFWGRGIATAALGAFLLLEPTRPLLAHVATTNVGSIRVLEKCGFVPTGRETGEDGVEELVMTLDA
jgi:RimJ/RimL family protein N-acetyltransferase